MPKRKEQIPGRPPEEEEDDTDFLGTWFANFLERQGLPAGGSASPMGKLTLRSMIRKAHDLPPDRQKKFYQAYKDLASKVYRKDPITDEEILALMAFFEEKEPSKDGE